MVIKPTELEILTKDEEKLIEQLEERIDMQILIRCDLEEKKCSVNIEDYTSRVQKRIIEMYKAAGWSDVEFSASPQKGYWITLTK